METKNQIANQAAHAVPTLKPDIVSNIPLHQAAAPARPVSEADDIDSVMKDVGRQLKHEEHKPQKRHWFGHKQPRPQHKPAAAPPPPAPARPSGPMPRQPAPKTLAPQPKQKSGMPVMAILFTLIITAFLAAAAIAAFKQ